jgi:hypothetical protein
LITNQADQSAQDLTQSRFAKYFHELTTQQQENYGANVKKYKRKKKQVAKITQKMLKINEAIRASIKTCQNDDSETIKKKKNTFPKT